MRLRKFMYGFHHDCFLGTCQYLIGMDVKKWCCGEMEVQRVKFYVLKFTQQRMETQEGEIQSEKTVLRHLNQEPKWWQKKPVLPLRILSFLVYLSAVMVNYFLGMETDEIADKFNLYVTPPHIFFIIWAILFITMGLVIFYDLIMNEWSCIVHIPLTINNIFLIVWINVFNIGNELAVFVSVIFLVLNVVSTEVMWVVMGWAKHFNLFTYIGRNIFAFYIGWVAAATNLNLGVVIVYWWGASYKTQVLLFWVFAPFSAIAITSFNAIHEGRRGLLCSFCLWVSVLWALTGAAMKTVRCFDDPTICDPNY